MYAEVSSLYWGRDRNFVSGLFYESVTKSSRKSEDVDIAALIIDVTSVFRAKYKNLYV